MYIFTIKSPNTIPNTKSNKSVEFRNLWRRSSMIWNARPFGNLDSFHFKILTPWSSCHTVIKFLLQSTDAEKWHGTFISILIYKPEICVAVSIMQCNMVVLNTLHMNVIEWQGHKCHSDTWKMNYWWHYRDNAYNWDVWMALTTFSL